jgi:CRP-like cAMP-binding protein
LVRVADLTEILSTDWAAMSQPDILSRLGEADFARVRALAQPRRFPKGDVVFRQGDTHRGIFIVRSGIVRTYFVSPGGREMTLAYWQSGNFVGGPDVFGTHTHMWSGMAIEDVECLFIGGNALKTLVTEVPGLAISLIEALAFKGRWFSAVIQMLGTRSVTERVAQLLLTLAEFHGTPGEDGTLISGRFTHDDLAQMVGSTRQWVTSTLDRFERSGAIAIGRRKIVVRRPELLLRALR